MTKQVKKVIKLYRHWKLAEQEAERIEQRYQKEFETLTDEEVSAVLEALS